MGTYSYRLQYSGKANPSFTPEILTRTMRCSFSTVAVVLIVFAAYLHAVVSGAAGKLLHGHMAAVVRAPRCISRSVR